MQKYVMFFELIVVVTESELEEHRYILHSSVLKGENRAKHSSGSRFVNTVVVLDIELSQ